VDSAPKASGCFWGGTQEIFGAVSEDLLGGTGKAEDAKLQGAGIIPKLCPMERVGTETMHRNTSHQSRREPESRARERETDGSFFARARGQRANRNAGIACAPGQPEAAGVIAERRHCRGWCAEDNPRQRQERTCAAWHRRSPASSRPPQEQTPVFSSIAYDFLCDCIALMGRGIFS